MSDSCCSLQGSSVRGIFQKRIMEWVAVSFSKRSSWHRNQTCISCFAGGFFTDWATRGKCAVITQCTEMVVKISYFCHFNVLNSVSLKFEVFETNSKKKISLLLFFLLFSLPCSPLSELSSLGVCISAWCISGLKMSVGESCSLVGCLLSHLAFRRHDLTPALYLANFSLWNHELPSAADSQDMVLV